mgnify:CR=1 FL=1
MKTLPVVSGKEVIKRLQKMGFVIKRVRGSHVHMIKRVNGMEFNVTVPVHGNRDLNPRVLKFILRQAGLSVEEFCRA